jgi:hypothetical protein
MSEIKSTLDLVMERTRNLSLSEEEKALMKQEEFDKRLRGLIGQYVDGMFSPGALKKRIYGLEEEYSVRERRPALEALLGLFDPDGDNERILDLLADWSPELHGTLERIIGDYQNQKRDLMDEAGNRLREHLAEHHGIRGSALLPNAEKDSRCRESMSTLRRETLAAVEAL